MRDQRASGCVGYRVKAEVQTGGVAEGGPIAGVVGALHIGIGGSDVLISMGDAGGGVGVFVLIARLHIAHFDLAGHVAGEMHAGVGARKGKADDRLARDGDLADLDVFDRRRPLLGGQIRSLSAGDGDDGSRRPEQ